MSSYKCPHCEYYMWEGKEFYECELEQENIELKAENEKLTKQRDILLGQLVINDGEDVTVQILQSQFDEYNNLKTENEMLKEENSKLKELKKLADEIIDKISEVEE